MGSAEMTDPSVKPRFLLDPVRLAIVNLGAGAAIEPLIEAMDQHLTIVDPEEGGSALIARLQDLPSVDQILIVGSQAYIEIARLGFALLEVGFDVFAMVDPDTRQAWMASKIPASGVLLMTEAECIAELDATVTMGRDA